MKRMTNDEAVALQEIMMRDAFNLMKAKRVDYSGHEDPFGNFRMSEFVGVEPWRGCLIRMMDKLSRIRHIMENNDTKVSDESLFDTFLDVINYTCILAGLCEEERDAETD
jgi:hypothetical protein